MAQAAEADVTKSGLSEELAESWDCSKARAREDTYRRRTRA